MVVIVALALYTVWTFGGMVVLALDACFALTLVRQDRRYGIRYNGFLYWFMRIRNL